MQQKFMLHPAWEKTIAEKDRKRMEELFQQAKLTEEESIQFTVLTHAFNYKNELLVTGIVHNKTDKTYSPNEEMDYMQGDELIASHHFSIPDLTIAKRTSMPWTFIFPKETILLPPLREERGVVKIYKK